MAYIISIQAADTEAHEHMLSFGERNDQDQEQATLDGTLQQLTWQQLSSLIATTTQKSGRYSLLLHSRSYEVFARRLPSTDAGSGQLYEILLDGQRFEVTVEDERSKKLAALTKSGSTANSATIKAPMPGLVLKLPQPVGSPVTTGQTVAVLEAMKMENDLSSPIRGTIKELLVQPGQTVELGQRLVVIEGETAETQTTPPSTNTDIRNSSNML